MKIGIIGYGVVGKAVEEYFSISADVFLYDPIKKIGTKEQINKCDLVYICVPTPKREDGSCDTSIVENVVSWIKAPLIVIKSTILPGTTDILIKKYKKNIVFSPEYISESTYYNPIMRKMNEQSFIILGGPEKDCLIIQEILSEISGPLINIYTCSAKEAELIKYFENTFFAMKIGFSNE